jgi:hypothetical protein
MIKLAFAMAMLAFVLGCEPASDLKERTDVERQQALYVTTQPPPFFDWSLERHLMTKLYEARNNAVTTYSYLQSPYTGKILSFCPSLGYPIPATSQLTNPQRRVPESGVVLPQAEPNGLYTPSSTSATWVMCLGPDGNVEPVYWESNVATYPRPMKEVDGTLVPEEGGKSSISIDPKRPAK